METRIKELQKNYRINDTELEIIRRLLGRDPQNLEWALFSALWSEHCSYKSSKFYLKNLYRDSSRVLQSFGENAGVIDLGEGEKIAFKIESHNHPSYIEPFQGAATGVGGIVRDILAMGARPILLGNYLCFGEPNAPRMKHLVQGVVEGIAQYGNCIGVPMLVGKTQFHSSYNKNILVNAMALGYLGPGESIVASKARGEGNLVIYVGAKTGRDGVHGARMASESFSSEDESKKPNIQIGDPFYEKLLIESCLSAVQENLVVAMQDMGAAGLISSSFEMASKGEVGIEMNLDLVPLRDPTMLAEEILVSESQERMLLIIKPQNLSAIQKHFNKWGLEAIAIGKVIDERKIKITHKNELVVDIDPHHLVENAPVYQRPYESAKTATLQDFNQHFSKIEKDLDSIEVCSRSWIYEQYDQKVGASSVRDCSSSIGVYKLPSGRLIGVSLGGRVDVLSWNAYWGGVDCVLQPALDLSIKGFEVLAVSDGLNFGNPEKPEIMGQFVDSLKGMNQVCEAIQAPIISGNVSLYNETDGVNIVPTIASVVVGLRSHSHLPQDSFQKADNLIYVLQLESALNESSQLWENLKRLRQLCTQNFVLSTRAVGTKSLKTCLKQMSLAGVGVDLNKESIKAYSPYDVVLEIKAQDKLKFESYAKDFKFSLIGNTRNNEVKIDAVSISTKDLNAKYKNAWEKYFEDLA